MRMLSVVVTRSFVGLMRDRVQKSIPEEPKRTAIGVAKSPAALDDLVEHRLESRRACNGPKHGTQRALLLAQVFELTGELRVFGRHAMHGRP
jgi:hypothetical protein